jgi:hypothetical protein
MRDPVSGSGDYFLPFAAAALVLGLLAVLCILIGFCTTVFSTWRNGG